MIWVLCVVVLALELRRFERQPYVWLLSGKLQKSERNACGWDLFSDEPDFVLVPGEQRSVKTGVVTDMIRCHALILDKSGLAKNLRVTRRAGVIDQDYPGEWEVILVNEGREPFIVREGTKIAQVMFVPEFGINVIPDAGTVVVSDVVRASGFGSTGV